MVKATPAKGSFGQALVKTNKKDSKGSKSFF
jgi:hypothetical protein